MCEREKDQGGERSGRLLARETPCTCRRADSSSNPKWCYRKSFFKSLGSKGIPRCPMPMPAASCLSVGTGRASARRRRPPLVSAVSLSDPAPAAALLQHLQHPWRLRGRLLLPRCRYARRLPRCCVARSLLHLLLRCACPPLLLSHSKATHCAPCSPMD